MQDGRSIRHDSSEVEDKVVARRRRRRLKAPNLQTWRYASFLQEVMVEPATLAGNLQILVSRVAGQRGAGDSSHQSAVCTFSTWEHHSSFDTSCAFLKAL